MKPSIILDKILNNPVVRGRSWEFTYVILGQSGPTGKTWLYNQLKIRGLDVVEISEDICYLVRYEDSDNHYIIDELDLKVIIVLNKLLNKGDE